MFDFVFVILCTTGLLTSLAYAALHENDGKRATGALNTMPNPSE